MSTHHAPRKMRRGHITARVKSIYTVLYLVAAGAQHTFVSVNLLPSVVLVSMVLALLALILFERLWHRDCMLCIIPPDSPATVADQKQLWLMLFHTRGALVLSSLTVVPVAAYLVGLISDPHGAIAAFLYTLALCYCLTSIADAHHTRLSLWCYVCNPGHGGNGDHHPTPIPTAPTTKE